MIFVGPVQLSIQPILKTENIEDDSSQAVLLSYISPNRNILTADCVSDEPLLKAQLKSFSQSVCNKYDINCFILWRGR